MLVKIKFPPLIRLSRFLEGYMPKKYGVRKIKIKYYVSIDKAADMLRTNVYALKKYLIASNRMHGFEVDGSHINLRKGMMIFIHPDTLLPEIIKTYRRLISKSLKDGLYNQESK